MVMAIRNMLVFFLLCFVSSQVRAMGALSPLDPSSFSRPEEALIKHISLSLNVDFENKVLSGVATLNLEVFENINEVILDSSKLNIESVELGNGEQLKFNIGDEVPNYGSKLTVKLDKNVDKGEKFKEDCLRCVKADVLAYKGFAFKPRLKESSEDDIDHKVDGFYFLTDKEDEAVCSPNGENSDQSRDETITAAVALFGSKVNSLDENSSNEPERHENCSSDVTPFEYKLDGIQEVADVTILAASDALSPIYSMHNVDTPLKQVKKLTIKIKYTTSPNASALQWLEPSQTSGKKYPYLFSQCQPIHARSILPCQDTPAVKFTYDAEVTAPAPFTVLMSALRSEKNCSKTTFNQPMPLPSYLVAIAVGDLESKSLGPRSKVWCEKQDLNRSAWEFGETERYLQAAERLCGKYEWTQYDLLVLPPSFPYGGMENPCLTFVTPTLLAGDRSQADVIVHEIMHSWTGNLVTNRNFEHFWLNEGFTVFLERKVAASLIEDCAEAKKSRDFHSLLGLQELEEAVNHFGENNPLTNLVPDLKSVHPDDAFSRVPYEKGSLFLRYLEDLVGGPGVFDGFLRSYLNTYSKKSLDTDDFKSYLFKYFNDDAKLKAVDWDTWLYKSGMPPVIPDYDTSMTKSVTSLVQRIATNSTFSSSDIASFTPHQLIYLLQNLVDGEPLQLDALKSMQKEYKLEKNMNSEIRFRWIRLCIRSRDESKLEEAFQFVNTQGRMKYVRPVYRDLYAWDDVRERTIENFLANEKYMMHVSAYTLRKDLHLSD